MIWISEVDKLEMGISPDQFIKAAHWTTRWAKELPSLETKENNTLSKNFTKYKISLIREGNSIFLMLDLDATMCDVSMKCLDLLIVLEYSKKLHIII